MEPSQEKSLNLSVDTLSHHYDLISVQWWVGLLELFVFLIGTPANAIVLCLAILSNGHTDIQAGRKRNITKYLITSMTSADLIFCLIHSPMMFLMFNLEIDFTRGPCLILFAGTHLSTVASSLSLLLINIDKFLHLRRPLHYAVHVTTKRGVCCVLVSWLISFVWALIFILAPFINHNDRCDAYLIHNSVYIIFAVTFFVIPTLISLMISIYVAFVVFEAKRRKSREKIHGENCQLHIEANKVRSSIESSQSVRTRLSSSVIIRKTSPYHGSADGHLNIFESHWRKISKGNKSSSIPLLSTDKTQRLRSTSFCHTDILSSRSPLVLRLRQRAQNNFQRQKSQFRRIGFVFTTTIWTTLTVLPYRVAFIVWNLKTMNEETKPMDFVQETIYFFMFALMTLNAAGNPFITIITQRQYSMKLAKLWQFAWKKRNFPK